MEWKFLVKRVQTPLFAQLIIIGINKQKTKKYLNVDTGFDHFRKIEGDTGALANELEEVKNFIRKKYKQEGTKFLWDLIGKWNSFFKELEELCLKTNKTDYSNKTDKELAGEFEKLRLAYEKGSTALMLTLSVGDFCEEEVKEYLGARTSKAEKYFQILTTSEKENESTRELESMLKMAIKLKNKEDVSKDIQKHIKEFGWINTRGFLGEVWTEEEIRERLWTMQKEELEERRQRLENLPKETRKETEKILLEIKADEQFYELVKATKEFVFFRTHRMDVYVKNGFLAGPLFGEIAKRLGLEMHDLFYLAAEEIKQKLLKLAEIKIDIEERKKSYGVILDKNKIMVLSGKELEDYKKKSLQEKIDKKIVEIKGKMASPGCVKGLVKVVSSRDELSKVEKGNILVASMTTPDFVPAMERAAAFVTDEGGILCHAAIVSREMGKPCVIGTKIATKVLKDGDLTEVDANQGIIKILKRK